MIEPLKIWKSEDVTSLLIDFYEANFQKAGIPKGHGELIVNTAFENKDTVSEADLQSHLNTLYLSAKTHLKESTAEANQLELIDFSNVKTFLDLGANRLDTINKVGRFRPSVEKLIGMDVIPLNGTAKYKDKTRYYQINPNDEHYPIKPNSVDIINIQYALHHFESDRSIKDTLRKCKEILKQDGRIVIWEESFEKKINIAETVERNKSLGFNTSYELTKRFYEMNEEKRLEFIIANDWLININNKHMQWTGLYKSWENWEKLFNDSGFTLKQKFNFGLRVSGHVKSGVHIIAELVLS